MSLPTCCRQSPHVQSAIPVLAVAAGLIIAVLSPVLAGCLVAVLTGWLLTIGMKQETSSQTAGSCQTTCASHAVRYSMKTKKFLQTDDGESSTTAGEETSEGEGSSSGSDEENLGRIPIAGAVLSLPVPSWELKPSRLRARLSPLLSKVLRHTALSWNLKLGEDGFVCVTELISLPPFVELRTTVHDVESVVDWERQDGKKQRFALRSGTHGLEIRANQGHSSNTINSQLLAQPVVPAGLPALVVHGTYLRHAEKIVSEGLRPMDRCHIHMFIEEKGVGRKDAEILIFVDVLLAASAGIEFLISENAVVLSTGGAHGSIPSSCFRSIVRVQDGAVLFNADQGKLCVPPMKQPYVPPQRRWAERAVTKTKSVEEVPGSHGRSTCRKGIAQRRWFQPYDPYCHTRLS